MLRLLVIIFFSMPIVCSAESCDNARKAPGFASDACLEEAAGQAQSEMMREYKSLLQHFDGTRRSLLSSSQKSWEDYKKRQCELEYDFTRIMHREDSQHGTMSKTFYLICLLRFNEQRLQELKVVEMFSDD